MCSRLDIESRLQTIGIIHMSYDGSLDKQEDRAKQMDLRDIMREFARPVDRLYVGIEGE